MATNVNHRVRSYRQAMRDSGMRMVQIWVPDTRAPGFQAACEEQCRRVAQADAEDVQVWALLDEALGDVEGWE